MSKSNSNKKTNFNDLSPLNKKVSNEKLTDPSLSNITKQNSSNKQPGIIEVYEDNFIQEIKNISSLLDEYNYIGMDTEFPGTVFFAENLTEDFYYEALKKNVNKLKLIQLGITLTNERGEYPKDFPYHTWQFNLEFDKRTELYKSDSINLLEECGIDFNKLKTRGIKQDIFAQYLMISNLVLNPEVYWVSFQGSYDFGYLLKLLINIDLPEREEDFINLLDTYFINYYDIRMFIKGNDNFYRGLNKLAEQLEVKREGKKHQAGSDSVVTIDVFFKLKNNGIINHIKFGELKNVLHGIGKGKDNDETINYAQIGAINYPNNIKNNMRYINLTLNTNYLNMNYYNYSPMMINNHNNNINFNQINSTQIQTLI